MYILCLYVNAILLIVLTQIPAKPIKSIKPYGNMRCQRTTKIWQSPPATYLLWLYVSVRHPCRRNCQSWSLEERTGDFPPGVFLGTVFFVLKFQEGKFLKPKNKDNKGDYIGGGYKFDSSKATPFWVLILKRNWKRISKKCIFLLNPAKTSWFFFLYGKGCHFHWLYKPPQLFNSKSHTFQGLVSPLFQASRLQTVEVW